MTDLLSLAYPWVKSLHIISVISWMAALFYLPRLFVYHAEEVGSSGTAHELFKVMEARLARVIMGPAMIATWIFGLMLVFTPGIVDWSAIWPWLKAISVLAMTGFHGFLETRVKSLGEGRDTLTGRQYRFLNEVPTLLMILIIFSVVVKF